MFNFLICGDLQYTNYFNVTEMRGIELICALVLLGVIIIANVIIKFTKPDYLKKSILISALVACAFALSIVIANVVIDAKDDAYKIENVDCRAWLEQLDYLSVAIIGTIILAIVLIATPFVVDRKSKMFNSSNVTKQLTYAAICIALSFGLSYIRLFKAPYGGSITLASLLPLALYSYMYGSKNGLIAGMIYGLLQFIQDPYFYHTLQFLLDYVIAFGFVGMAGGLFRKILKPIFALPLGLLVGVVGRFLSHFISGAVFFGVWAPETFTNIWTYSLVYNILYVAPDAAIALVASVALLSSKQVLNLIQNITSDQLDKKQILDQIENTTVDA